MILPIENWPSPCKEVAPTLPAAMEVQPPCSWSSPPQGWGLSGRHTDPTTTSLHAVACHPPHHLIQTRFSTHGTRVFRIKTLEKAYTPTGPWAGGCDSFHLPIQPASSQGRRLGIQSPIPPHLFFFFCPLLKQQRKEWGTRDDSQGHVPGVRRACYSGRAGHRGHTCEVEWSGGNYWGSIASSGHNGCMRAGQSGAEASQLPTRGPGTFTIRGAGRCPEGCCRRCLVS